MGSGGSSADGSCYCEHGLNKVLVLVYGPQEAGRRGGGETQINEQGSISCQVLHAPFSGTERKKRKPSDRKAVEIETLVKQTFTSVVMLDLYQSSEIHFVVNILESDGSTECTIVNACTMALLDAGIAMSDMVIACSVGDVKQRICIDLNMVEQNSGGSYMPIAMRGNFEDIVHMQLQSRISAAHLNEMVSVAGAGCRSMHEMMSAAIKAHAEESEVVAASK